MASMEIGGGYLVHRSVLEFSGSYDQNARPLQPPLMFSTATNRHQNSNRFSAARISMSMAEIARMELRRERKKKEEEEKIGCGDAREKLDGWMRETVVEIVKNLSSAPLLVHVYAGRDGRVVRTVEEGVEDWETVKGRWEKGEVEMPEGMIFVEQLQEEEDHDGGYGSSCGCGGGGVGTGGGVTRAWGLVVQAREVEGGGPVCYLLKTTRVGSGLGIWCTHFCLVRVQNFRETTKSQLQNCWLVQANQ